MQQMPIREWDDYQPAEKALLRGMFMQRESADAIAASLLAYTIHHFQLTQGERLEICWYHRYYAWAVARVITGEFENLLINVPPGSLKTEFFSIHLPAWCMDNYPKVRILNASYSKALVEENSNRTRTIMENPAHGELFPTVMGKNQIEHWEVRTEENRLKHVMFSKPSGGQITGITRAGYMRDGYSGHINMDDWDKPEDVFSEVKRGKSKRKITNTMASRRAHDRVPVICIQQRLHVEDVSGVMMACSAFGPIEQICIPALIDEAYISSLPEPIQSFCRAETKGTKQVTLDGVKKWSYWPKRRDAERLLAMKEADPYTFMSQYMQAPDELSGDAIDVEKFRRYHVDENGAPVLPSDIEWLAVYGDTAQKDGERNDWSVLELWAKLKPTKDKDGKRVDHGIVLLDLKRGRWKAPQLKREAVSFWSKHSAWCRLRYMAIEDKSSGTGLIQDIEESEAGIRIKPIPRGAGQDKGSRWMDTDVHLHSGLIWIPDSIEPIRMDGRVISDCKWLPGFLLESSQFTYDDTHPFDDQIDPMMDATADMLGQRRGKFRLAVG